MSTSFITTLIKFSCNFLSIIFLSFLFAHIIIKILKKELFSKFNLPQVNHITSLTISAPTLKGKVQNGVAILSFNATEYANYDIYLNIDGKETLLETINFKSGEVTFSYPMPKKKQIEFYIKTKIKNYKTNLELESEKSNSVNLYYSP